MFRHLRTGAASSRRLLRAVTTALVVVASVFIALVLPAGDAGASSYPGPVTGVTSTPGDGSATVSWTYPLDDGGSPLTFGAAGDATITHTCSVPYPATSCTITGLTNGVTYQFYAVAGNANGYSQSTAVPAPPVTPESGPTAPDAPTGVVANPGPDQATVSWTPAGDGGSPITGFTASAAGTSNGGTCADDFPGVSATNAVCGSFAEGQNVLISAPPGEVFTGVASAYYGTPSVNNGVPVAGACDAAGALSVVTPLIVGQATATFTPSNSLFGTDPCPYTPKQFFVVATFSPLSCTTPSNSCTIYGLAGGTATRSSLPRPMPSARVRPRQLRRRSPRPMCPAPRPGSRPRPAPPRPRSPSPHRPRTARPSPATR